jgi:hypothetical protein
MLKAWTNSSTTRFFWTIIVSVVPLEWDPADKVPQCRKIAMLWLLVQNTYDRSGDQFSYADYIWGCADDLDGAKFPSDESHNLPQSALSC